MRDLWRMVSRYVVDTSKADLYDGIPVFSKVGANDKTYEPVVLDDSVLFPIAYDGQPFYYEIKKDTIKEIMRMCEEP